MDVNDKKSNKTFTVNEQLILVATSMHLGVRGLGRENVTLLCSPMTKNIIYEITNEVRGWKMY